LGGSDKLHLTQDHLEAIKNAAEQIKFGSVTVDINDLANYLEITTTIKERLIKKDLTEKKNRKQLKKCVC
jgi:hypothetical protein